jgi:hypothetical protein
MLVVQCATGYVGWIFRFTGVQSKAAICTFDNFSIAYDASPTDAWIQLVQSIVAHSVSLKGAFQDTHWFQP